MQTKNVSWTRAGYAKGYIKFGDLMCTFKEKCIGPRWFRLHVIDIVIPFGTLRIKGTLNDLLKRNIKTSAANSSRTGA